MAETKVKPVEGRGSWPRGRVRGRERRKDGCRQSEKMAVVREKMAVVSPAACAMGRKGEHGKGPASYRGLGLRPAVAGLPSHLPWPPKAAAGSGLASGPLAPAFSGPFNFVSNTVHLFVV